MVEPKHVTTVFVHDAVERLCTMHVQSYGCPGTALHMCTILVQSKSCSLTALLVYCTCVRSLCRGKAVPLQPCLCTRHVYACAELKVSRYSPKRMYNACVGKPATCLYRSKDTNGKKTEKKERKKTLILIRRTQFVFIEEY